MNFRTLSSYANSQSSRRDSQINNITEMTNAQLRHIEREEQFEVASQNEVYDYFSNDGDEFFAFTGFTIYEFDHLFNLVENFIARPSRG